MIGTGPAEAAIREIFARAGMEARLHIAGILQQQQLTDALHAMDLFAFASTSETQGMVLTEAMAAGLPVVALDAPGAREVVRDRHNGRLLPEATPTTFSAALQWVLEQPPEKLHGLKQAALATAEAFSMPNSADNALACYEDLRSRSIAAADRDELGWEKVMNFIEAEWDILKSVVVASEAAMGTRLFSEKDE
ncbi:MAG: glycosyltransferase [Deltaproteobacteria bacterium]|nr:glycosyltransferase [Deltaproteobacteria bacterium]